MVIVLFLSFSSIRPYRVSMVPWRACVRCGRSEKRMDTNASSYKHKAAHIHLSSDDESFIRFPSLVFDADDSISTGKALTAVTPGAGDQLPGAVAIYQPSPPPSTSANYVWVWPFLRTWRSREGAQHVCYRRLLLSEVQVRCRAHSGFDWKSRYRHWGKHWDWQRDGQGISHGLILRPVERGR